MMLDKIKKSVLELVPEYPIKRVVLFGSRAEDTCREDSDVDLIMEFTEPISLLTLSCIKVKLETMLNLNVDIVHGPIQKDDLIEVNKEIELYAA